MTLDFNDNAVTGLYFYTSYLKDIRINGILVDGRRLSLEERDAADKVVARFDGTFQTTDPRHHIGGKLECEVIVGIWQRLDRKQEQPFYLALTDENIGDLYHQYIRAGIEDDERVNRGAQRFQNAVKQADKKAVASLIDYSIKFACLPPDPATLIRSYDLIFTPDVRKLIARAIPRAMQATNDGVLLADGLVYFDGKGKVIQFNTCSPLSLLLPHLRVNPKH